jgi:hypothetical protein
MPDRKNLKIDPETFELISRKKPEGMTWDLYLRLLYRFAFEEEAATVEPHPDA